VENWIEILSFFLSQKEKDLRDFMRLLKEYDLYYFISSALNNVQG